MNVLTGDVNTGKVINFKIENFMNKNILKRIPVVYTRTIFTGEANSANADRFLRARRANFFRR